MSTLYVSDLDGTLLNTQEQLSDFTADTINLLINSGVFFSYATARSFITASKVTNKLSASFPAIVYNGAFIIHSATKEMMLSNYFSADEIKYIKKILTKHNIFPIAYAYIDGKEHFSFYSGHTNTGKKFFLDSRKNDIRRLEKDNPDNIYLGDLFYFSCIGEETELMPIYDIFKNDDRFNCIFQKDIYSGSQWCEILPSKATKANAILQLKEYLGCERIISFGDSKNDISMFEISDECYAVKNAISELKEKATGIIDSNNDDGVAKWLKAKLL